MRSRARHRLALTAEELVQAAQASGHADDRDQLRKWLADIGYTPLDLIRAQYWLRRGKPSAYRWDDQANERRSRR